MTEASGTSVLRSVSMVELKRVLISYGFSSQGDWGRFLERYHLNHGRQQFDVIVPKTHEIADYDERMAEAVRDLARAIGSTPADVLRLVLVSASKSFRVRAHPGEDITSIPFDEGFGLLQNAKLLIKASVVSAFSVKHRRVIRGRNSMAVDRYMDKVRLGQSEIGSYVFNLLLPEEDVVFGDESLQVSQRESVAAALESGIELAAEMNQSKRIPAAERLEHVGLSANFCEALYNIVDWSDKVELRVSTPGESQKRQDSVFVFDRGVLSVLERTAVRLAPEEQRTSKEIAGTITRLSEPASKRRGSIDLLVRLDGRQRSIRVNFEPQDRDTVIMAFKDKDSRLLSVSGYLKTERNGHLVLDDPSNFDASRRGSLL